MCCNYIERRMAKLSWITYSERAVEVVFGHMINMGNYMYSHPGTYCIHISCFDLAILLLKIVECFKGFKSSNS